MPEAEGNLYARVITKCRVTDTANCVALGFPVDYQTFVLIPSYIFSSSIMSLLISGKKIFIPCRVVNTSACCPVSLIKIGFYHPLFRIQVDSSYHFDFLPPLHESINLPYRGHPWLSIGKQESTWKYLASDIFVRALHNRRVYSRTRVCEQHHRCGHQAVLSVLRLHLF